MSEVSSFLPLCGGGAERSEAEGACLGDKAPSVMLRMTPPPQRGRKEVHKLHD